MTSDEEPQREPEAAADGGEKDLFSKLPRTRPGVRSPRRAGSKQAANSTRNATAAQPAALRAAAAADEAREATAAFDPLEPPAAAAEEAPETEPAAAEADAERDEHRSLSPAGLEDLAWAGVAVTAEAATLGVRLLGRAVEAAKRATERS
jgi:hypothetical protein